MSGGVLKPFRWPRLWVGLWCLAIVAVAVLSLVNLSGLPPVPVGGDKVEHFLAYALLSASAMQLFATRRACIVVALLLVAMGVVLEFAQGTLTATRMAEDVIVSPDGPHGGVVKSVEPVGETGYLHIEVAGLRMDPASLGAPGPAALAGRWAAALRAGPGHRPQPRSHRGQFAHAEHHVPLYRRMEHAQAGLLAARQHIQGHERGRDVDLEFVGHVGLGNQE